MFILGDTLKKIFSTIGGLALIALSFYFTDKVSLMVARKSELMQKIEAESDKYYTAPVNAIIEDDTIIPGRNGTKVNQDESYMNMHDFGIFNYNYLVINKIKPDISLEDNKDKIIVHGNPSNRNISIIVENDTNIIKMLNSNNIEYDVLISNYDDYKSGEIINTGTNKTDFLKVHSNIRNTSRICMSTIDNNEYCKKYGYYIVKPSITLDAYNTGEVKNSIDCGSIILIKQNTTIESINLILKEIKYKDLNIVKVSELINE